MSVFAGGSISVCVYVKHTCTFPEGDNTVLLSLQQLAREWTLGNVAVIHTEQTAGAERFQDLANCKQINKHYTRGAGGAGRKRWKELRRAETPASYPAIVICVKNTFILDLGDTSSLSLSCLSLVSVFQFIFPPGLPNSYAGTMQGAQQG